MTPRFLLDENQRGPLWDAIERHNAVVEFLALASGASDAAEWRDALRYIPM